MAFDVLLRDTIVEAADAYYAALAKKSVSERARMISELCESIRRIAKAGARRRVPHLTERKIELEVMRLAIGDELFSKAFLTKK